jgi:hypothetical protein
MNSLNRIVGSFKNPATRNIAFFFGAVDLIALILVIASLVRSNWRLLILTAIIYAVVYTLAKAAVVEYNRTLSEPSPVEYPPSAPYEDEDESQ